MMRDAIAMMNMNMDIKLRLACFSQCDLKPDTDTVGLNDRSDFEELNEPEMTIWAIVMGLLFLVTYDSFRKLSPISFQLYQFISTHHHQTCDIINECLNCYICIYIKVI